MAAAPGVGRSHDAMERGDDTVLTEIKIHNYKSFEDFSWSPGQVSILLGGNGAGKSALFEVLERLRDLVRGEGTLASCFPFESCTRWSKERVQRFELSVQLEEGSLLHYLLEIEHTPGGEDARVARETLVAGSATLFAFQGGVVRLHDDRGKERAKFTAAWKKSGLAVVADDKNNPRVKAFRDWLDSLLLARPNPALMDGRAPTEDARLRPNLDNFASWYRHCMLDQPKEMVQAGEFFAEVAPWFQGMTCRVDEQRIGWLKANFEAPHGVGYSLRFEELSDGQRVLFALFVILFAHGSGPLMLDEPDNFLALPEIQPLLLDLLDRAQAKRGPQLFIISHHPEYLNQLAPACGWVVGRDALGATRVERFVSDEVLPPSELVARRQVGLGMGRGSGG